MKKKLLYIGLFLAVYGAIFFVTTSACAQEIEYQKWDSILETYVNENGRVDYDTLHEERQSLDDFIKNQIEDAQIDELSPTEQKAFWINAYNALTVQLILDHYPPAFNTIRTINWGRPWNVAMLVAGNKHTLHQIEHDILRNWEPFDERIHFALNCASIGCPKLPQYAFDPEQLDQQLDSEARRFIRDPEKVRLDRNKNILYHSEIFAWFEADFLKVSHSLLDYIYSYLPVDDQRYIDEHRSDIRLQTLDYDWGLNKQE